jgi:hypothetical protein
MKAIDLELSPDEKLLLKTKGISQKKLLGYAADEIIAVLEAQGHRAKALQALVDFQRIPSIGIMFAKDLMRAGYYSLDELKTKPGAYLFDEFENMNGYHTDPCVEDQFRLVVHYANNPGSNKKWWDFTNERKAYRVEYPYELK